MPLQQMGRFYAGSNPSAAVWEQSRPIAQRGPKSRQDCVTRNVATGIRASALFAGRTVPLDPAMMAPTVPSQNLMGAALAFRGSSVTP